MEKKEKRKEKKDGCTKQNFLKEKIRDIVIHFADFTETTPKKLCNFFKFELF